ncbi:MAG TPA: hypothetical protein VGJ43_15340, partial [Acidimicrobiales bacterium]
ERTPGERALGFGAPLAAGQVAFALPVDPSQAVGAALAPGARVDVIAVPNALKTRVSSGGGASPPAPVVLGQGYVILALRTADGAWVYPAFQLDGRNRVVAGLAEVLDRFRPGTPDDEWMVAAFLAAPQPGLDDRSVVDHLRSGGALDAAVDLAAERAERWALAS